MLITFNTIVDSASRGYAGELLQQKNDKEGGKVR